MFANITEDFFYDLDSIEERNLQLGELRRANKSSDYFRENILKLLSDNSLFRAVTVYFTDLEGSFRCLDYDKKFFVKSYDNLTFDGSSVRGFSSQDSSDMVLSIDWTSCYYVPADVFGPGKVVLFANVHNRNLKQYESDFRGVLQNYLKELESKEKLRFNVAPEIEGFLLHGIDAEQNYSAENGGFKLVTTGGYYNALPQDPLRMYIDQVATAKRAMGFQNEKDHPEVAPSQFELNYKYNTPVEACDQIQIYKLICRQVAKKMGYTASFLPKPLMNVNGSGMHTNISAEKDGKNIFYSADTESLSDFGKSFASAILYHAKSLCLVFNSSVNSYRRLDPKFEAPTEIKMSDCDRGSMIRIPYGNERSTRIEVRSVAPDSNPYLAVYSLIKIGMLGLDSANQNQFLSVFDERNKLPGNIYEALKHFRNSNVITEIIGKHSQDKFADLKEMTANRAPRELGKLIKKEEVIYHHEITNQFLWSKF